MKLTKIYESIENPQLTGLISDSLTAKSDDYYSFDADNDYASVVYDSEGKDVVIYDIKNDVLTIKSPKTNNELYELKDDSRRKYYDFLDYIQFYHGMSIDELNDELDKGKWIPYTHKVGVKDASIYDEFFYNLNN